MTATSTTAMDPTLGNLAAAMSASTAFARARTAVQAGTDRLDIACARGAQPLLAAAITSRPLLVVTATSRAAEDLARALGDTYDRDRVAVDAHGRQARGAGQLQQGHVVRLVGADHRGGVAASAVRHGGPDLRRALDNVVVRDRIPVRSQHHRSARGRRGRAGPRDR